MILVRGRGDYQAQLLYSYSLNRVFQFFCHFMTFYRTKRFIYSQEKKLKDEKNVLKVLAKIHFNLDGHDGEKFSYRITMKDYLKKTQ